MNMLLTLHDLFINLLHFCLTDICGGGGGGGGVFQIDSPQYENYYSYFKISNSNP